MKDLSPTLSKGEGGVTQLHHFGDFVNWNAVEIIRESTTPDWLSSARGGTASRSAPKNRRGVCYAVFAVANERFVGSTTAEVVCTIRAGSIK